jgi:hypothetical protein
MNNSGLEPAGPEDEPEADEENVAGELDADDDRGYAAGDYDDAELHWNASSSG